MVGDVEGRAKDAAGDGFFEVELPDDVSDGRGFTRAGNFTLNAEGELVMANSPGFRVRADFTIPQEATEVSIGTDGIVSAMIPGSAQPTELGQLTLLRFINPAGLESRGNNIYTETEASGAKVGIHVSAKALIASKNEVTAAAMALWRTLYFSASSRSGWNDNST